MSTACCAALALAPCDDPEPEAVAAAAPSPLRARYLRMRDEAADERHEFVRAVFGDPACFAFSDEGTFALSRAAEDYDVLILDAADPLRMARFLRLNGPLLRNVAKFAVMQESSPPRRTRMLAAGCDDVLDSTRQSPEEARLRVAAVMRRHHARWASWQEDERLAAKITEFAVPGNLTPRELALLAALAEQPGKSLSARQLSRLIASPDPAVFRRSLRFAMSRLRGKLHPCWRIAPAPGEGYALTRIEG